MQRYFLHTLTAVLTLWAAPLTAFDAQESLQKRAELHKPADYRAAVSPIDFQKSKPYVDRSTTFYEVAALSLGYKHCMKVYEPLELRKTLAQDHDLLYMAWQAQLYYTHIVPPNQSHTSEMIIYSSAGRNKAFILLLHEFGELFPQKVASDTRKKAHAYLRGRCFGYPEEDIRFFMQRAEFYNQTGEFPEVSEAALQAFSCFQEAHWPNDHEKNFTAAKEVCNRVFTKLNAQEIRSYLQKRALKWNYKIAFDIPLRIHIDNRIDPYRNQYEREKQRVLNNLYNMQPYAKDDEHKLI